MKKNLSGKSLSLKKFIFNYIIFKTMTMMCLTKIEKNVWYFNH